MPRPKRSRRAPFVLTVTAAAVATPLACGGTAITSDDGTGQGGTAGSGTAGTRASGGSSSVGGSTSVGGSFSVGGVGANPPGFGGTSGGFGGVGGWADGGVGGYAVGGVGGTGGSLSVCPPTRPSGVFFGPVCSLPPGVECTYVEHCQSGDVTFFYACTNGYLALRQTSCTQPYDSCPGTSLWCGPSGWTDFSTGTNPPAPCPAQRPANGSSCSVFDFGANISPCGYHCEGLACGSCPSGTWLTTSCVRTDADGAVTGAWQGAYCGPTPAP